MSREALVLTCKLTAVIVHVDGLTYCVIVKWPYIIGYMSTGLCPQCALSLVCLFGAPRVFSWRLKIGQIWGFIKTEDLKMQLLRYEYRKTALFCHFFPPDICFLRLKILRQHLKSEDSKYAFVCWGPIFLVLVFRIKLRAVPLIDGSFSEFEWVQLLFH